MTVCTPAATATYNAGTTISMSPTEFCMLYLELCVGANRDADHIDMATCVTSYTADRATVITPNGSVGGCESYHLCNVYNNTVPTVNANGVALHCTHASGTALCL